MKRFALLFSLLALTTCSGLDPSKSYDAFLADNCDISIDEWNNWSIDYRMGSNFYLATIKNEVDSNYSKILIIPGDSLSFMFPAFFREGEEKKRYSIRTLTRDSVDLPVNVNELRRKSVFVIHNNIFSISCWDGIMRVELFKKDKHLIKTLDTARVSNYDRIDSLWYIQR